MSEAKITRNIFASDGAELGVLETSIETGIVIASQAKKNCPRDEGELVNTIMVKAKSFEKGFNDGSGKTSAPSNQKLDLSPKDLEVFVGTNSDHWYPEFGTRYQVAQPFLRPAIQAVKGQATRRKIVQEFGADAMRKAFLKRKVRTKRV